MSAQIITARDLSDERKLTVSFRLLLGLYSIIPLCLALQNVRWLVLARILRENLLPTRPTHFLLFQILFGTPHILASSNFVAKQH